MRGVEGYESAPQNTTVRPQSLPGMRPEHGSGCAGVSRGQQRLRLRRQTSFRFHLVTMPPRLWHSVFAVSARCRPCDLPISACDFGLIPYSLLGLAVDVMAVAVVRKLAILAVTSFPVDSRSIIRAIATSNYASTAMLESISSTYLPHVDGSSRGDDGIHNHVDGVIAKF